MSNLQQTIDLSPLTEPLTQSDIEIYKQSRAKPHGTLFWIVWIAAAIGAGGAMMTFVAMAVLMQNWVAATLLLIFIIGLGGLIATGVRYSTRRAAYLYKFATRNAITVTSSGPSSEHTGMIFSNGHSRRIREAFVLPGGFEIGNYEYSTGSGKNRTTHMWSYVRIKLARRLPHMVIDARSNNFMGRFSNLPNMFSKDQRLSLEGDFDSYYTLYAPARYKSDALYIFTPDVMAALIDTGAKYDMEVVDDNLFMYRAGVMKLEDANVWRDILTIVDTISSELRSQSDYYADERVVDARVNNVVGDSGRRLKRRFNWLAIVIVAVLIGYYVVQFIAISVMGGQ